MDRDKETNRARKKAAALLAKIEKTDDPKKLCALAVKADRFVAGQKAKSLTGAPAEMYGPIRAAVGKLRGQTLLKKLWAEAPNAHAALAEAIDDPAFLMTTVWEEGREARWGKAVLARADDRDFLRAAAMYRPPENTLPYQRYHVPAAAERLLSLDPPGLAPGELADIAAFWYGHDREISRAVEALVADEEARKSLERRKKAFDEENALLALWRNRRYDELYRHRKLPESVCAEMCTWGVHLMGKDDLTRSLRLIDEMERRGYPWTKHAGDRTVRVLMDAISHTDRAPLRALRTIYRERPDLQGDYRAFRERTWRVSHADENCLSGHRDEPGAVWRMAYSPAEGIEITQVGE